MITAKMDRNKRISRHSSHIPRNSSREHLRVFLNRLQKDFHRPQFLSSDPLEFAHRYPDPWDQEAIALPAALLAYGNVKQIRRSLEDAISRVHQISRGPQDFVLQLGKRSFLEKANQVFSNFVHRFNSGADLIQLWVLLNQSWSTYGSLGGHFLTHLKPEDPNIGSALSAMIADWRQSLRQWKTPFAFLISSPASGSCCKRWCMFLRWMGRKDEVDLGLWSQSSQLRDTFPKGRFLEPRQLVMPLDTHTGRISQYLGLTNRRTLNWQAALEVTESLKKIDPQDPTCYDFSLSRLGILDICQRSYREEICKKCQLLPACRFAQKFSNGPLPSMPSLS